MARRRADPDGARLLPALHRVRGEVPEAGQNILHTIQTNGTLLDDEWCAFFKKHNFLVGLSVDGPKEMHDAYRVNKGGAGSFDQVMRGWETLRRHEVDVNILCTIHAANGDHPLEVYRFFRDQLQASLCSSFPLWSGLPRISFLLPTWAGANGPARTGRCTYSTADWSPNGRSAPNSSAAS